MSSEDEGTTEVTYDWSGTPHMTYTFPAGGPVASMGTSGPFATERASTLHPFRVAMKKLDEPIGQEDMRLFARVVVVLLVAILAVVAIK